MAEEIQHTEESLETPSNVEATETHTPNEESETKMNAESEKTPMQNAEEEAPSEKKQDESPQKKKSKFRNWIDRHTDPKQVGSLMIAFITTIIGGLIVWGIPKIIVHFRCNTRPYITFESDFTQVFNLSDTVPNLEYSVGEKRWKKLGTQSVAFGGSRGKLMLRGKNNKGTDGATISFSSNAEVVCTGDIRTLIDYNNYCQTNTDKASFRYLFAGCKQLVVAPELPAMELAICCYCEMFQGCTSLKTAPLLPAMELADDCYFGMFMDCSSLETPPYLPATQLVPYCYYRMFSGCTSLKEAPYLPATKLADDCYSWMFAGCSSLYIIVLHAIEIPDNSCFYHWLDETSPTGIFFKMKKAQWSNEGIVPPDWEVRVMGRPDDW